MTDYNSMDKKNLDHINELAWSDIEKEFLDEEEHQEVLFTYHQWLAQQRRRRNNLHRASTHAQHMVSSGSNELQVSPGTNPSVSAAVSEVLEAAVARGAVTQREVVEALYPNASERPQ